MAHTVFISHSGEDTWVAKKLSSECEGLGTTVFLDEAAIAIGASFERELLAALSRADELILLATPWALERPYIWLEIGAAWQRQIPIIVLLLGISVQQFQSKTRLPIALKERNILRLNDVDRYLDQLVVKTQNGESK